MYLDYKQHKAGVYVIDIETDDLNARVIHVMCWRNLLTGKTGECTTYEDIQEFFASTAGGIYIGHNILKFDGPVLNRLAGTNLSERNCIDTLVLSTLYSPSLEGGHSLDAWGEKMGEPKIAFNAWGVLTPEMIRYCHQDVLITAKLFVRLMKTLASCKFSERSIWLQHRLTVIIERQHQNGFQFDGERALCLYQELRSREAGLAEEIRVAFPAKRVFVATRSAYKKDGSHSKIYRLDCERYEVEGPGTSGRYDAFERVEFNIGSPLQRIERLLELGWVPYPDEYTEKTEKGGGGNPRPFIKGKMVPSLEKFLEENDHPAVKLIGTWMAYNGRANMVNTWLENWNENDGRIHGKLFVADTLRFRHQAPNTANIPAVRVKEVKDADGNVVEKRVLRGAEGFYTYEARDLWVARKGRVLVGTDAAGLELRMLAHYLNRPDFTKQVIEGDPHQYNADVVGITRPQAKTLIYAIMYGAAAPKIAATLGVPVKEGGRIRQMFLERLGLKELIEECQHEQKNGRVELVDGSQVICPSPHAALNYKLQGGGARVMGMGSVLLERTIVRRGLDSIKVGDIHDEWQYDCLPDDAGEHASESVAAIIEAGRVLNLNVPLDGTPKQGKTWAETH
jgi:DNA polymerase-1